MACSQWRNCSHLPTCTAYSYRTIEQFSLHCKLLVNLWRNRAPISPWGWTTWRKNKKKYISINEPLESCFTVSCHQCLNQTYLSICNNATTSTYDVLISTMLLPSNQRGLYPASVTTDQAILVDEQCCPPQTTPINKASNALLSKLYFNPFFKELIHFIGSNIIFFDMYRTI